MWFRKNITLEQLKDFELITKFKESGDQKYCAELYQRYVELIYGVCLKYFKDADKSKDHTLLIYETLLNKLPRFEVKQFRSWLYVLVKNHALQALRKKSNGHIVNYDPGIMHSLDLMHPIDEYNDNGKEAQLKDCLNNLPEKQKNVIQLFYYQGKSYDDIANQINERKDKVRSYIQNGRRNLKICIEKKNELKQEDI